VFLMSTAVAHDLVQKSLIGEALDSGPIAVFVADDDGKYLAVNAYACELLGYEREELLALRVTDVAINDDAEGDYEKMIRRGGTHLGLTVLRRKDGSEISMHFRAGETTVGGMLLYLGVCWPAD
jgi:PAS domain S-box-containing protein